MPMAEFLESQQAQERQGHCHNFMTLAFNGVHFRATKVRERDPG